MVRLGRRVRRRPAPPWAVRPADGAWIVVRPAGDVDGPPHPSEAEAIRAAHQAIRAAGGGELVVEDGRGAIRRKDTVD